MLFAYSEIYDNLVLSSASNHETDPCWLSRWKRVKRHFIHYIIGIQNSNPRTISNACHYLPLHPPLVASRPLSPGRPTCPAQCIICAKSLKKTALRSKTHTPTEHPTPQCNAGLNKFSVQTLRLWTAVAAARLSTHFPSSQLKEIHVSDQ